MERSFGLAIGACVCVGGTDATGGGEARAARIAYDVARFRVTGAFFFATRGARGEGGGVVVWTPPSSWSENKEYKYH